MTPAERSFLADIENALERVFMDRKLRIPAIARAVGISDRHLQRRVRALTGMTPTQYLGEYRLLRGRDYLRAGVAVGDAAHAAGFASHAYFAHRFKKRFGVTPSVFKTKA